MLSRQNLILVIMLVLSMLPFGCASRQPSAPNQLPWVSENGRFFTRDVEKARQEGAINFVLPAYLPRNLGKYPYIVGPLRDAWPESYLRTSNRAFGVEITYQDTKDIARGLLRIEETLYPVGLGDPSLNPEVKEVEIGGVQVKQRQSVFSLPEPGRWHDVPGLHFNWTRGDLWFYVEMYGYDYAEAARVVESMIQ